MIETARAKLEPQLLEHEMELNSISAIATDWMEAQSPCRFVSSAIH
jgi:hypothetical protein